MTARKPLVPQDLRDLLTVMRDLSVRPPLPAEERAGWHSAEGAWNRRQELATRRSEVLAACLDGLVSELGSAGRRTPAGVEELARYCRQFSDYMREELAKPLGYEPETEKEAGH